MIRLSKSCIGEEEKNAVLAVLDQEFLGMGPTVGRFEQDIEHFLGTPAVCVVNGTAALHLALQACGVAWSDEVLVPSLTYVASFQAISAVGARPIACDVHPDTLTIDVEDARRKLTHRTKAIMPVHYAGDCAGIDSVFHFATESGLRVIEDAAHAFGSAHRGKKVGSFGDVACFSFDGIKNITSGEGGCVVSNDDAVLNLVRDARLLGVNKDSLQRYSMKRSWSFDVTAQGYRYHMSEIMAAIGIVQLRRFPEMAAIRRSLSKLYDSLLADCCGLKTISHDYDSVVPHIYVVILDEGIDRKMVQDALAEQDIQTGYHYQPNHWLTLYKESAVSALPVTDHIFPRLLTLPLHADLSPEDIRYVAKAVKSVVEGATGA